MISIKESFAYWNYFIALEEDLYKISRFIEFNKDNFKTYSIELAKLLISASSQVDIILRDLCSKHSKKKKKDLGIQDYLGIIKENFKWIINQKVRIIKYGLIMNPFENLKEDLQQEQEDQESWWAAYNRVKHNMNTEYIKANLKNVFDAMGALFIVVRAYYLVKSNNIAKKDIKKGQLFLNLSQVQQDSVLFSTEQRERGPYL